MNVLLLIKVRKKSGFNNRADLSDDDENYLLIN